jgi:MFS transporter, YQGE family, putative transporter
MKLFSIKNQSTQFRVFNTNARKLITANFLFGLFNPFYLIFSNTYIFNSTKGDITFNLIYCLFNFIGIISGFIINGYLLRIFHVKKQLIMGSIILFISVLIMFMLPMGSLTGIWIFVFGLGTGIGNGIYWSSRNYLTMVNTNDNNRNFFSGIDFILISSGRLITPLLIGLYIGEGIKHHWFNIEFAYRSTLVFALVLLVLMTIIILPRKFKTQSAKRFLYWKYSKLWNKARFMVFNLGFYQGSFLALPAILIMQYVGNESAVGSINSISYLIAIIFVYYVSKNAQIQHRTLVLKGGAIFLLIGSVLFSIFLHSNAMVATVVLLVIMFISDPVLNFPFRASFMKVADEVKQHEKRDNYAYIVDIELFTAFGRILSLGFFFVLYKLLPVNYSLPIYMVIVALMQFINIRLSKEINGV